MENELNRRADVDREATPPALGAFDGLPLSRDLYERWAVRPGVIALHGVFRVGARAEAFGVSRIAASAMKHGAGAERSSYTLASPGMLHTANPKAGYIRGKVVPTPVAHGLASRQTQGSAPLTTLAGGQAAPSSAVVSTLVQGGSVSPEAGPAAAGDIGQTSEPMSKSREFLDRSPHGDEPAGLAAGLGAGSVAKADGVANPVQGGPSAHDSVAMGVVEMSSASAHAGRGVSSDVLSSIPAALPVGTSLNLVQPVHRNVEAMVHGLQRSAVSAGAGSMPVAAHSPATAPTSHIDIASHSSGAALIAAAEVVSAKPPGEAREVNPSHLPMHIGRDTLGQSYGGAATPLGSQKEPGSIEPIYRSASAIEHSANSLSSFDVTGSVQPQMIHDLTRADAPAAGPMTPDRSKAMRSDANDVPVAMRFPAAGLEESSSPRSSQDLPEAPGGDGARRAAVISEAFLHSAMQRAIVHGSSSLARAANKGSSPQAEHGFLEAPGGDGPGKVVAPSEALVHSATQPTVVHGSASLARPMGKRSSSRAEPTSLAGPSGEGSEGVGARSAGLLHAAPQPMMTHESALLARDAGQSFSPPVPRTFVEAQAGERSIGSVVPSHASSHPAAQPAMMYGPVVLARAVDGHRDAAVVHAEINTDSEGPVHDAFAPVSSRQGGSHTAAPFGEINPPRTAPSANPSPSTAVTGTLSRTRDVSGLPVVMERPIFSLARSRRGASEAATEATSLGSHPGLNSEQASRSLSRGAQQTTVDLIQEPGATSGSMVQLASVPIVPSTPPAINSTASSSSSVMAMPQVKGMDSAMPAYLAAAHAAGGIIERSPARAVERVQRSLNLTASGMPSSSATAAAQPEKTVASSRQTVGAGQSSSGPIYGVAERMETEAVPGRILASHEASPAMMRAPALVPLRTTILARHMRGDSHAPGSSSPPRALALTHLAAQRLAAASEDLVAGARRAKEIDCVSAPGGSVAAIHPTTGPAQTMQLPSVTASRATGSTGAEINQLANRVYEILVKRLASERRRREA